MIYEIYHLTATTKRTLRAVIFLSTILIAGCEATPIIQRDSQVTACPAKDVSVFFEKLSSDVALQRTHTTTPLKKTITVDGDPEPFLKTELIPQEEINFPIIPSKNDQLKDGLVMRLREPSPREAIIILEKPDTDYQIAFIFKMDKCWVLSEVIDYSL